MAMEKTFDAKLAEERLYAAWEQAHAFDAGANAAEGAESFCVMIPPPNVTGSLHMGHAFNNTLQDILVRWHRMRGFDTLWQPGTDHAGIATQMVVERELARLKQPSRRELGREAFLEKVWQWKEQSGGTIIGQLKRLGASCDWKREAFTMSGNFPDAVTKVFVEMYQKGLIYRGKRLVNWDPHFETAISDLEVENIEVDGHMWHFKYMLADDQTYEYIEKDDDGVITFREKRNYISIATTRPETMLGDGAVAVHPSDARYAPIVGKMVHLPLCDRLIPIITDEYPDPNFGSGAVKITGAHDFNDYQVAKRSNLPLYRLLDTRGHMRDDGPTYAEAVAQARAIGQGQAASEAEIDTLNLVPEKYRGLDRFTARAELIKDITAAGLAVTLLVKEIDPETGSEHLRLEPVVEAKKIMQPFGDRSKVVIEPMLTDQWFVDTQKVVGPALEAVRSGVTKIIPDSGEKTYFHWLENIEPWCISRQLWWGHQIPVWYDGNGKAYCATSEIEASALANGQPLTRDSDVLDTWFSSGLWPIGTLGWPEDTAELARYFPTTTLITGADIIFFWVARMMMMQLAVVGEVPFKTVYLHGLVRDAKGKKMSKSLGNVIDPIDIIDEFGADALRFANAAMASLGGTLKMDKGRIAGYRNFGTKLWNACRFAEMNGVWEGHITQSAPPKAEATANRWIIAECAALRQSLDDSLDAYRFDDAAHAIYSFVWGKVCDWYVEFAKPMFDTDQADETRKTMAWVLDQSMILLHPIMPFITEELWGTTGRRAKMLVHSDWPTYGSELDDPQARREMNWVTALIDEVRSARAQMHVPAGLKVAMLRHDLDRAALQALGNNQALILRLARLESITQADTSPKGAITVSVEGGRFSIPLAGIIDIGEEKARLNKTIEKLQKELSGLRGRLKNPNFVASAPPEVVEESREKLALGDEEIEKLSKALSRLAEIG
ncbi:MAG: valine--tRNA ligase [Paracoccaceae bacterium]|nr:valine--tRNA ligase [Paracoccaceae bacterium]MDP5351860.1 valine--tRNA ligase [Paracoccaceae bacterium]MDP5368920.1 valine--tRNA ligase [Paracoccaceae bacterium]